MRQRLTDHFLKASSFWNMVEAIVGLFNEKKEVAMEIQVEVDVYCDGKTEHVTIAINESDIANMAENKAANQYTCLSAAAKRIEVKPYVVNL